jgi:hypothetical protein
LTTTLHRAADRRRKDSRGGRPPSVDPQRYKQRTTAERCINKLKQFRAVATRYDKRDHMYRATLDVATVKITPPPAPRPPPPAPFDRVGRRVGHARVLSAEDRPPIGWWCCARVVAGSVGSDIHRSGG